MHTLAKPSTSVDLSLPYQILSWLSRRVVKFVHLDSSMRRPTILMNALSVSVSALHLIASLQISSLIK